VRKSRGAIDAGRVIGHQQAALSAPATDLLKKLIHCSRVSTSKVQGLKKLISIDPDRNRSVWGHEVPRLAKLLSYYKT
jgi:hypothetical protein